MNKPKILLFIIIFLLGMCFRADAYERWWNYYAKGIDHAKDGRWAQAAEAFKMALNQDSLDRRRARTYGMHFIEYYPHRKLGIAYFNLKNYDKAIAELSLSLSQVDDPQTRNLLEQARQRRAAAVSRDISAPTIAVNSPADGSIVRDLNVVIVGSVSDDVYVGTVTVNNSPASITPGRETSFSYLAALTPGKNTFRIKARDGSDKQSVKTLTIICDPEPPLITTNLPASGLVVTTPAIELRGVVTDNVSVESVSINGEPITGQGQRVPIHKTVALAEGENKIVIETRDSAGNKSSGTILIRLDTTAPEIIITSPEKGKVTASRELTVKGMVRDARGVSSITINDIAVKTNNQKSETFSVRISLKPGENAVVVKARNLIGNESIETIPIGIDAEGPIISLSEFPDNMIIYNVDTFAFKGTALDMSGVKRVLVNQSELSTSVGTQVMFSFTMPLKDGDNPVEIAAYDTLGNRRVVKKLIRKETKDIKKIGARLAVAVVQLEKKGSPIDWNVEERLTEALLGVRRFTLVEKMKLEEVMKEQAFGLTGAVDPSTAARVGRLVGADAILIGSINNEGRHFEIDARLVNAESGSVISAHSAYGETGNPESRRRVMEELAQKFRGDFPLVDGIVVQVEKDKVYVDIGAVQGIRKGTKCVIYRDEDPIKHPITGEILGYKTRELGSVVLREVYDKMSEAVIIAKNLGIKVGDRVVTK